MTETTASPVAETALVPARTRPVCPFYGFVGMAGILVDCHGNGCGMAGGHRPCAMEMSHKTPSWEKCQFNHDGNRRKIEQALDCCQVFPDELRPQNASGWKGIDLRKWYQLIMHK